MISKEKLKTIEDMLEGTRFLLIVDNGHKVSMLPQPDNIFDDNKLCKFVKKALIRNTDFGIVIVNAIAMFKEYFKKRSKP